MQWLSRHRFVFGILIGLAAGVMIGSIAMRVAVLVRERDRRLNPGDNFYTGCMVATLRQKDGERSGGGGVNAAVEAAKWCNAHLADRLSALGR